jgi:MFS transporter, putative metabolite:H+ symporter
LAASDDAPLDPQGRLTSEQLLIAVVCAVAFGLDLAEVGLGSALSAVFASPPHRLGSGSLGGLVAAVYVGSIVGAPVGAWLWRRLGYRKAFGWLLVWLAATSIAAALSPTWVQLTGARFLSGLSLGAYPPLMVAYIREVAPPGRRGLLLSVVCGFAYLAPPLCLIALRALTATHPFGVEGWRWPFAATAPLCLAAAAAFRRLPEPPRRTPTADHLIVDPPPASRLDARMICLGLIYFLIPWAGVGFPIVTGPALLARGVSLSGALGYVSAAAAGPFISTVLTGLFLDRVRRRPVLIVCAGLMLIGIAVFFELQAGAALAAVVIGVSALNSTYIAVMTLFGAELFRTDQAPRATSLAWAFNRLGAALAPVLLLALLRSQGAAMVVALVGFALVGGMALVVATPGAGAAEQH